MFNIISFVHQFIVCICLSGLLVCVLPSTLYVYYTISLKISSASSPNGGGGDLGLLRNILY